MDIATASASASALVGALQLWREVRSAQKEGREISKEIIDELGDKIRDAQDDSLAMRDQLHAYRTRAEELGSENERLLNWSAQEKERYKLHALPDSLIVYSLKQEYVGNPDPMHSLCPKCYTDNTKSIVQVTLRGNTKHILCPVCGVIGGSRARISLPR